jgi:hypothetical protein
MALLPQVLEFLLLDGEQEQYKFLFMMAPVGLEISGKIQLIQMYLSDKDMLLAQLQKPPPQKLLLYQAMLCLLVVL